jgi:hypothetical protein
MMPGHEVSVGLAAPVARAVIRVHIEPAEVRQAHLGREMEHAIARAAESVRSGVLALDVVRARVGGQVQHVHVDVVAAAAALVRCNTRHGGELGL